MNLGRFLLCAPTWWPRGQRPSSKIWLLTNALRASTPQVQERSIMLWFLIFSRYFVSAQQSYYIKEIIINSDFRSSTMNSDARWDRDHLPAYAQPLPNTARRHHHHHQHHLIWILFVWLKSGEFTLHYPKNRIKKKKKGNNEWCGKNRIIYTRSLTSWNLLRPLKNHSAQLFKNPSINVMSI